MSQSIAIADNRTNEPSATVYRTSDPSFAEFVQVLLAANKLQAAVRNNAPIDLALAALEVIVLLDDRAIATNLINQAQSAGTPSDWRCPACHEEVHKTFDFC